MEAFSDFFNVLTVAQQLAQALNGYDNALISGYQSMPSWNAGTVILPVITVIRLTEDITTALEEPNSSNVGLLNAVTYLAGRKPLITSKRLVVTLIRCIFSVVISPVAAFVADRWGRKWCIRYSSVTNLIGTAIGAASGAGGSNGYAAFMVSRIIVRLRSPAFVVNGVRRQSLSIFGCS